ncbi:MAG: hypothetical protein M1821_004375 [Bathelium mastoideum]|nr:MAG: hypothetical protein M1821_004375 [Bathelium mastoideum]
MLSAVTGSVFTSLLVTPLDVVRVRLQSQSSPSSSFSPAQYTPHTSSFKNLPSNLGTTACCREEVFWLQNNSRLCLADSAMPSSSITKFTSVSSVPAIGLTPDCAAEETRRRTFNSTVDGLRKIARNEGVLTLWRGLSPTLMMAVPGNVIYFAGYDWLRTSAASPLKDRVSDAYAPFAAGSVARVVAALFVSPIEMLRTRMQHAEGATGVMSETMRGLRMMVGSEGYRSLWRGLSLTLWRDVPFSGLYWWGYEVGRDMLVQSRGEARTVSGSADGALLPMGQRPTLAEQSHSTLLLDSFIAGAGSGAVAAFVTTPFDVGKTRQQVVRFSSRQLTRLPDGQLPPERRSMPQFLWHIFKTEGTHGLFKGWAARCLKVAPACAIMISSYEIGKKMAGTMNERTESRDA